MYVLDKLWRGKLSPSEQCINADSEYSELRHKAVQLEKQVLSNLSVEGKQMFQEYQDLRERMSYISEEDMFVNGFRIGVGLLLDAVGTYDSQFLPIPRISSYNSKNTNTKSKEYQHSIKIHAKRRTEHPL